MHVRVAQRILLALPRTSRWKGKFNGRNRILPWEFLSAMRRKNKIISFFKKFPIWTRGPLSIKSIRYHIGKQKFQPTLSKIWKREKVKITESSCLGAAGGPGSRRRSHPQHPLWHQAISPPGPPRRRDQQTGPTHKERPRDSPCSRRV